jgi:hypothetical protein
MSASRQITFFKPQLSHFVETMACFLAADPELSVRIVTSRQRGSDLTEHPWILERLEKHNGIELVDLAEPAKESWLLIFGLVRRTSQPPALREWLRRSEEMAIFPEANRYGSSVDWLRELARSFPRFLRARFVILERKARLLDFRFGCSRRLVYTPSVHPQFLHDEARREAMFGPVNFDDRRFRIAFLGNRQPPERSARLDASLRALREHPALSLVTDFEKVPVDGMKALWLEYDTAAGTTGLDPTTYAAALGDTDYCVSPPGWGGNWTHRTIEAIARGTVPILEDPEVYNLPFIDGVNCLLVRGGDWSRPVAQCLTFDIGQVMAMREAVVRLRKEFVLPDAASQRFRRAFLKAAS